MKSPTSSDVRRRWRFVPRFLRRWLYVENMLEEIDFLHDQLPAIYCEISGGMLSYPHYSAKVMIAAYRTHLEEERERWEEDFREENECRCGKPEDIRTNY